MKILDQLRMVLIAINLGRRKGQTTSMAKAVEENKDLALVFATKEMTRNYPGSVSISDPAKMFEGRDHGIVLDNSATTVLLEGAIERIEQLETDKYTIKEMYEISKEMLEVKNTTINSLRTRLSKIEAFSVKETTYYDAADEEFGGEYTNVELKVMNKLGRTIFSKSYGDATGVANECDDAGKDQFCWRSQSHAVIEYLESLFNLDVIIKQQKHEK